MNEFLSLYGKYIIGGVLAVAIVGWIVVNGTSLVDKAASLTSKSNDYTETSSEREMKAVVESKLPEVVGVKEVTINTAYLISYDSKQTGSSYLLQTKDENGIVESCTISLMEIKGDDNTILMQKNALTSAGESKMTYSNGKLTFLQPGIYKFKVDVADVNGASQMSTVVINVGEV